MLIEVQYDSEDDYFHRMVYGISKLITQYIQEGQPYGQIKKAYSINILYFGLGQGSDYLYEYRGEFFGMNDNEVFLPSKNQQEKYKIEKVSDIFPKYYIIRVNHFKNEKVDKPIDEWIYFLQKSEIKPDFHSRGMNEAKQKLRYEQMPDTEKQAYNRFVENRRIELAVTETAKDEGFREGIKEGIKETAKKMKKDGLAIDLIAKYTGLSATDIENL